jgi:DNA-binding NarL/FixJ family response regulator
MKSKITVMLADDHQLILDGLSMVLKEHPHIEVLGTALNGEGLLGLLQIHQPDIAVVDISMPPGIDGIQTAKKIAELHPHVKVLILTMHKDKEKLESAIMANVKGYLLKNHGGTQLLQALEAISEGRNYYSDDLGKVLIQNLVEKAGAGTEKTSGSITDAELEVLMLVARGLASKQIADQLHRSIHTVNTHRKNIIAKLKVSNIHEAITWARRQGLLE